MKEPSTTVLIGTRSVSRSGNSRMVTVPEEVFQDMGVAYDDDDAVMLLYDRDAKELTVQPSEEALFDT